MLREGESFVYTACPGWGDHDYCALKTIVKDGKIVRTEKADYTGAEANEGYICQKGIMSCRQPYNPKRLTHPLKRVGERGEGKWEKKAYGKGFELGGKTLGVIGYGRIGKRIGDIAQGIGMNVIAYQRTYKPEYECDTMHFVTLDELLEKSDIIALSTPALGKAIIDAESIAKMKDGVVIINTSRGSNIDEAALLDALNSGKVRAAGLDVWAEEPTKNVELSQHPAVSALPHIGASTAEAQKRIGSEIVSIIENF